MAQFPKPDRARLGQGQTKISTRLIGICSLLYLITAILFTLFEGILSSNSQRLKIENHIQALANIDVPILASAMWDLDRPMIRLIVSNLAGSSEIAEVDLYDENDILLLAAGQNQGNIPALNALRGKSQKYTISHTLANGRVQKLGSLYLYPSRKDQREEIRSTIISEIVQTLAILICLVIVLALTLNRYLSEPLREISTSISRLDYSRKEGLIPIEVPSSFGELSILLAAFNQLIEKVNASVAVLRQSEQRLWILFEESPISIWEEDFSLVKKEIDELKKAGISDWEAYFSDLDHVREFTSLVKVLDINSPTLKLLGYSSKEAALGSLAKSISLKNMAPLIQEFADLARGAQHCEGQSEFIDANGKYIPIIYKLNIVSGYETSWERVLISVLDISGRVEAEDGLKRLIAEKELLLREVHHRVKNNLQVVESLISLEIGSKKAGSQQTSLLNIDTRIRAIALVHEMLYSSNNFSSIPIGPYLSQLCSYLLDAYAIDPESIAFGFSIDDLELPLDKAITCGLIVNEVVTNSFKHAFPEGRCGRIEISMKRIPEESCELTIRDDGVGTRKDLSQPQGGSLGVNLIESLVLQLGGSYSFTSGEGLTMRAVWKI